MNFFQTIIYNIAKKFGLSLKEDVIEHYDYNNTSDISLTATIASRVATLTMMDSTISVKGYSERAKYLDNMLKNMLVDKIDIAAEVALGTGDCLLKPYTDGSRIGVDIIKNGDFYICESCGDFIKACIIKCEELKKDNYTYARYEVHRLRTIEDDNGEAISAVFIYQLAFKNDVNVPLYTIPDWADLDEEVVVPYADTLLFGRIKSPTVNRRAVNSTVGVPITYGLDKVMSNAIKAYDRLNDEFERKEAFIFASKSIFKRDKDTGNYYIPNGKRRIFMLFPNQEDNLIHEYSPDIRDQSMIAGIEQNYKMLEMLAGLSSGILTSPTTNYATATEIKASLSLTFAYMTKFRRSIEQGIRGLIYSISTLCDINYINPYGEYSLVIDWSSAYVENLTEQYSRLIEGYNVGAVSQAEIRAWLLDKSIEEAESDIEELEKIGYLKTSS